jgi:hypothetical protein
MTGGEDVICLQCNMRPICKVFDLMTTTSGLEVDIKSCAYSGRQISFETVACAPVKEPVAPAHPARDLNDVAARIKKATTVVAVPNLKEGKIKCTDCGEEFPESHLIICSGCGKHFCETHSTTDMSSKRSYCEPCWDNNAPPAAGLPD